MVKVLMKTQLKIIQGMRKTKTKIMKMMMRKVMSNKFLI